ncbi:RNA polymerase sigma-70 factor, ECF subfamily [Prosthecobacter debontii]|uniref:RNA polymerase sigma-70 factor, ECF subfamily n=1 Tax=Prosthecobacter debontii TaxID=48467 RepID=A0A1T4WRB9_9BACT|nr:sigma-70 family RNA polymerase sigma factor [Prosthecobacter debontii]SKA79922.1 RNA polymerase sigma-70 factor, ECF subfamily [Prosthecobacter debontii]
MSPAEIEQHQRFLRALSTHEPTVRAYIRRLVPSRSDADDVMQEVVILLWEKFGEFREGAEFLPWAFGIARYKVLSWLRDRGRDRLVLSEEVVDLIAEETAQDETRLDRQRRALETCTQKLEPEQRDLLMRAYQPQAQIQNIAVTSGRSVAGFYQWLHRIRRSLLDCIQREMIREEPS